MSLYFCIWAAKKEFKCLPGIHKSDLLAFFIDTLIGLIIIDVLSCPGLCFIYKPLTTQSNNCRLRLPCLTPEHNIIPLES